MEAEAFLLGHWDNFEDMEIKLSLPELNAIINAAREQEFGRRKFAAALKGVDLDDTGTSETAEERFDRVKRQAEAIASGKSETEVEFNELGFGVELE
jgi:hypothetical protein